MRALNEIAERRGQTLAQMALAWTLRDPRVTSTLVGASSVAQLEQNVAALDGSSSPTTSSPRSTATPPSGHQPVGTVVVARRVSDAAHPMRNLRVTLRIVPA